MNILHFVPAGLKHVAGTSGGEHAGPCPWCGGTDRFRVWPEHTSGAAGGRFLCRGCGRSGDGIQFLRDSAGLSYPDACRALQVDPGPQKRTAPSARPTWTPKPATAPCDAWQDKASAFVAECAANMTPGSQGMAYAERRHLTASTVRALGIGWNPEDAWQDRAAWGLPPETNAKGNAKRVWLPSGLVIPSRRKAGLFAAKIRRTSWTPDDSLPKYVALPGSVPGLVLGAGGVKPLVIVESELDAVLVWQEARDLVGVLALGTASGRPDADTTEFLNTVPRILVALDFDRAGLAAWPWWPRNFPQAELWSVAEGKDVGDMSGTPGLVRAWIEAAMPPAPEADEPATVRLLPGQIACRGCGKPFMPSDPNKVYCSARCFNHMHH